MDDELHGLDVARERYKREEEDIQVERVRADNLLSKVTWLRWEADDLVESLEAARAEVVALREEMNYTYRMLEEARSGGSIG